MNETEQNYKIHNKEMLTVIRELEAWRYLLESTKFKFEIWMDHKNLEYFMKMQKLNCRQVRWALYLSRFDFILKHMPGIRMEKVDSLSRRLDWKVGVENDNENQKLIKEEWVRGMIEVVVERPKTMLLEKIKKARGKDKEVVKVVEEIKKVGIKNLREEEWEIERDLVLKKGKMYVPKDKELRMEIVWLHHNMPVAEYGGRWKMIELVTRNY